jgi:hypothetical protein
MHERQMPAFPSSPISRSLSCEEGGMRVAEAEPHAELDAPLFNDGHADCCNLADAKQTPVAPRWHYQAY